MIDDCDYYMVILAGRYGSIGPDGFSYTEMEYWYALETGKPVIGFVHREPGKLAAGRTEATDAGKAKLVEFRDLVQKKMCRFWESPADLGSQVSRSLVKLIKSHPGIGWVRGNLVPDESATEEILSLRKKLEELETELQATRSTGPAGTADLAQGEDLFGISYTFVASPDQWAHNGKTYSAKVVADWDEIFSAVSPLMIDEATESELTRALNSFVQATAWDGLHEEKALSKLNLMNFKMAGDDFQKIKVQLRALGLITKSTRSRSVNDNDTYWTLTPFGDTVMTRLLAIRKPTSEKGA